MTRKLLGMAALFFLLGLRSLTASPDNGDRDNGEMRSDDSLQGTWVIVSFEFAGQKQVPPGAQQMFFTFDRGKVFVHDGTRREEGAYRMENGRKPKGLDLIGPKGRGNDTEVSKGIYTIEGDILKLAFAAGNPRAERPNSFDGKEVVIMIFKRKK
jgi:uncharacterized protein (TIGR03067 family)